MLLAALGSVRIGKNCDLGLENAALGLRPRAAFSRPRSQFFPIRTSQPANNIYLFVPWSNACNITKTHVDTKFITSSSNDIVTTEVEYSTCKYLWNHLNGKHNRHTTWYLSLKEKKIMSSYFEIGDDLNSAVSTYTLLQQPH